MKKNIILLAFLAAIFLNNTKTLAGEMTQVPEKTLAFIENRGQWNPNVKYLLKSSSFNAWITNAELVYDYYNFYADNTGNYIKGDVIKMKLRNVNSEINFVPTKQLPQIYNYFSSEFSAGNVALYEEISAENIYDGINIRYYFDTENLGQIRYDFEIMPNANPDEISFKIEGAKNVNLNENNELTLSTQNATYYHKNIFAYQINGEKKQKIECKFTEKDGKIGFEIGKYNSNKKLIIDPLIYSVLVGSVGADYGYSVAVDSMGAAYIAGETYSPQFPTTAGSYSRNFNQNYDPNGNMDAFVSKISADGSQLIFSTFIGGSKRDRAKRIALDNSFNIIVLGETESANTTAPHIGFPLKSTNSSLARYNGGWDIFVVKLNNSGNNLIFSVLLGGDAYDVSGGLFVDSLGKIYVSGEVSNSFVPFLTTAGAYSQTFSGGTSDALIAVLNSNASEILYSTLFGGEESDAPTAISVDENRNICLIGNTDSGTLAVTPLAYQQLLRGKSDAFVVKFDSTLSNLLAATYVGGGEDDFAQDAAVSLTDNSIYVCGYSNSTNFPTTNGAFSSIQKDSADVIVFRLNSSLSDLIFSTTISSNSQNYATGIAIAQNKDVHIAGYTKSTNFPTTYDAFFDEYSHYGDAFYSVFDSTASNLIYSSYIGGQDYDYAYGLALDKIDAAYIVGATTSGHNFPHSKVFTDTIKTTPVPQTLGSYDVLLFKATDKPYPGELETNINNFGSEFCLGLSQLITISTPYAFYYQDNIFTVQLSDTNGKFLNPVVIGTLAGSSGGSVTITFSNNLQRNKKYRIRVISSRPRSIGNDNGIDLTLSDEYLELLELDTSQIHCAGEKLEVFYFANSCFNNGNTFNLELSDINGNFSSPVIIGSKSLAGDSASILAEIPANIAESGNYKVRLVSTNPALVSAEQKLNLSAPKVEFLLNDTLAFCANEEFNFQFLANRCFAESTKFFIILSNLDGEFNAGCDTIFNGTASNFNMLEDTISLACKLPTEVESGSNYRLRLAADNPAVTFEIAENTSISIGEPHIFTSNFADKQFCESYDFSVAIEANNCFESDNIFEIYVKIGEEFVKIGESSAGDSVAKFTMPNLADSATGPFFMKIVSTNPAVETPEFQVEITTPKIEIDEKTLSEACAGQEIQLYYFTNGCFNENEVINVELSDSLGNFDEPKIIGNGFFSSEIDGNNTISVEIPANIVTNSNNYKLHLTLAGVTSQTFDIKIIQAEVNFAASLSDISVLCSGISFHVNYFTNGCFDHDNVFKIELSDEFGNFNSTNPMLIGESSTKDSGRIFVQIPANLRESENYKFKIMSNSPATSKTFDGKFTIQKPEIIIDSLKNLQICVDKIEALTSTVAKVFNTTQIVVPFSVSNCFDTTTNFILELAAFGDFSQAIKLDTCSWNEREFSCNLPEGLADVPYRMRVISTSPVTASKNNGLDIEFAQAEIKFSGNLPTAICKSNVTKFEYFSTNCFADDNIFYLEISDNTGNFDLSHIIAYSLGTGYGVFNAVLPDEILSGDNYKLRIRSTSPSRIFNAENLIFSVMEPKILTGEPSRTLLARNDTVSVPFNTICLNDSIRSITTFVAQLSDPKGNFKDSMEIGSKVSWEPNGLILSRIPLRASDGNRYRIRVVAKEPIKLIGNTNGEDITIRGNGGILANEKDVLQADIYPNPFDELISVTINNSNVLALELCDLMGRTLAGKHNILDNNTITFNTENLQQGIYFINIYTNFSVARVKIVKISK